MTAGEFFPREPLLVRPLFRFPFTSVSSPTTRRVGSQWILPVSSGSYRFLPVPSVSSRLLTVPNGSYRFLPAVVALDLSLVPV